jgi:hypothetical protein
VNRWILALVLTAALAPALVRAAAADTTVRVRIEATELDKKILLEKLNDNGKSHHQVFVAADDGFDYRIVFETYQEQTPTGNRRSGAHVTVYDKQGHDLFSFTREQRITDSGATNAVAKEIIKRLHDLQ